MAKIAENLRIKKLMVYIILYTIFGFGAGLGAAETWGSGIVRYNHVIYWVSFILIMTLLIVAPIRRK